MKKLNLLFIMLVLLSFGVFATSITVNTPSSNQNISGNYNFTATITLTDDANITYCTFANTLDGVFANISWGNVTSYDTYNNTASFTDTTSSTITVSCYNGSYTRDLLATGTATGIAIDNSDPVCSCTIDRETINLFDMIEYDCSDSSDTYTQIDSYSCVITYDNGDTETETDEIGKFEDTISLGESTISCTVTDGTDHTNTCSDLTVTIKGDGDVSLKAATGAAKEKADKNKTLIIVLIAIVIVAIIVASGITAATKNKKRKKR